MHRILRLIAPRLSSLRQSGEKAGAAGRGSVQNGEVAKPVALLAALVLGACAAPSAPPSPAPPDGAWTWEVSYEDQGYRETVRGARCATAEEARRALADHLRGRAHRPLRARVVPVG